MTTDQKSELQDDLLDPEIKALILKDLRVVGALFRTALSSEQCLMSWMRTALSLFGFGFAIPQFFYFLEQQKTVGQAWSAPRLLGFSLILVGLVGLILAIVEHAQRLKIMRQQGLPSRWRFMLPLYAALALLVIGAAALVSIILNVHL